MMLLMMMTMMTMANGPFKFFTFPNVVRLLFPFLSLFAFDFLLFVCDHLLPIYFSFFHQANQTNFFFLFWTLCGRTYTNWFVFVVAHRPHMMFSMMSMEKGFIRLTLFPSLSLSSVCSSLDQSGCVFMLIYSMRYQSRCYYWLLHGLWRPNKRQRKKDITTKDRDWNNELLSEITY